MITKINPRTTKQTTFGIFTGNSRQTMENALKKYNNKAELPPRDIKNLNRLEMSHLNVTDFTTSDNHIAVTFTEPVTGDIYGDTVQLITPNIMENLKNMCIHSEIGARHYQLKF